MWPQCRLQIATSEVNRMHHYSEKHGGKTKQTSGIQKRKTSLFQNGNNTSACTVCDARHTIKGLIRDNVASSEVTFDASICEILCVWDTTAGVWSRFLGESSGVCVCAHARVHGIILTKKSLETVLVFGASHVFKFVSVLRLVYGQMYTKLPWPSIESVFSVSLLESWI